LQADERGGPSLRRWNEAMRLHGATDKVTG
jgi:hypothetical protein